MSDVNSVGSGGRARHTDTSKTQGQYDTKYSTKDQYSKLPSSLSGPSIANIDTVTKDKDGVAKSPYTSSEELAGSAGPREGGSTVRMHASTGPVGSSKAGGALDRTHKQDKTTKKDLLLSLARFDKLLKKLIQDGDNTIDALKSALSMATSGVASFSAGSQTVNSALLKGNLESLSKIDKKEILSMTSPSEIAKTSQNVVALGLVLGVKPTEVQNSESTSKYQQQPKDSFNDTASELYNFIHKGVEFVNNLSSERSKLASRVTIKS